MRHAGLILVLLVWGCGDPETPGIEAVTCERDADCPDGNLCRQGQCAETVTCRTDDDCFYGEECQQGACVRLENYCERNGDCPDGQACERETRMCVADEGDCSDDNDCFRGEVCDRGACVPEGDAECEDDDDCRSDEECVRGMCEALPDCRVDGDCRSDEICDNGECIQEEACTRNSDCDDDEVCEAGNCVSDDGCRADRDCPRGAICDGGACIEGCREDGDCDRGLVCEGGSCVQDQANNGNPTCDDEPDLCSPNEECCDGVCVTRGDCNNNETCTENPGLCQPSQECCEGLCVERGECGPDDYWDICGARADCSSELCLGDPRTMQGHCTERCTFRDDCPQVPASLCIQSYHNVAQNGGNAFVGLCYEDDSTDTCRTADDCFDGICIGRIVQQQADFICSIRCRSADDCLPGLACGPKEFEINGQTVPINVCLPVGAACSGDPDTCYSGTCVTDENNRGYCTTFCSQDNDPVCPEGWACTAVEGGRICTR